MAYDHENFLIDMGFKEDPSSNKFSKLGKTYTIDSKEMSGDYWFYDHPDFAINIHNFNVKEDLIVEHAKPKNLSTVVSVSFLKNASGECLNPYENLSSGSCYPFFHNSKSVRFILHGGFPYLSIGIEYKKNFLEEYLTKIFKLKLEDMDKAFKNLKRLGIEKDFELIANEILNYKQDTPLSSLFYEVKAKELLTIIVNKYFENKHIDEKLSKSDAQAIENVCKYIDDHYTAELSQDLLCKIALMSKTKFKYVFKEKNKMTLTEYIQRKRINVAEHLMLSSNLKIGDVAKSVGYNSHSRFTKIFKKYVGMYPQDFIRFSSRGKKQIF